MDNRLLTFAEQARHLTNLAAQLKRDARALGADLAFTDCDAYLTAIATLAGHASEAAAGRVEGRRALEARALLSAEEREQAGPSGNYAGPGIAPKLYTKDNDIRVLRDPAHKDVDAWRVSYQGRITGASTTADSAIGPLPDYFDAFDAGEDWLLRCKVCRKGWALKKTSTYTGNTLHLLNHAYSHKPEAGREDDS